MATSAVEKLSPARSRVRRVLAAGLTGGLLSLGLVTPPAVAAGEDVRFEFNQSQGVMTALANLGTAQTRQRIAGRNGGEVQVVPSFRGNGNAARFPGFNGAEDGPRAAIAVTNRTSVDELAPGLRQFSLGAQIHLSTITGSSQWDDGNNVIQRGLFQGPAQYKLQVEQGRASCRIKGSAGAVQVIAPTHIRQNAWYGLTCWRIPGPRGATVGISVTPIAPDGTRGRTVTNAVVGPVGAVNFAIGVPMSVGCKLLNNGAFDPLSDQFNGRIDNAFLRIR